MARAPDEVPDATLRLLLASGLGPVTRRRLRQRLGSDDAVVAAGTATLAAIDGVGPRRAAAIRRGLDAADCPAERAAMAEHGASLVLHGDPDYPPLLAAIPDPPSALWVRGALLPADHLALAIVGARRCTAYGREQSGRLAALLAECGLTIVSGGAAGIDGEAHRGALRAGGRTVAVLGCGLAVCYPPRHRELFERIARHGALLSEHPMATEPRPAHFPHRNRIISGLSLGVLVIEAARRSGALITARHAAEDHGREAMALPGRVDSPASAGCHAAVREGWAALVTNHADVLGQLDAASHLVRGALEAAGHAAARDRPSLFNVALTAPQQAIVETLRTTGGVVPPERLAAGSGLPLSRVLAEITLLQIRGHVEAERGGVRLRPGGGAAGAGDRAAVSAEPDVC